MKTLVCCAVLLSLYSTSEPVFLKLEPEFSISSISNLFNKDINANEYASGSLWLFLDGSFPNKFSRLGLCSELCGVSKMSEIDAAFSQRADLSLTGSTIRRDSDERGLFSQGTSFILPGSPLPSQSNEGIIIITMGK